MPTERESKHERASMLRKRFESYVFKALLQQTMLCGSEILDGLNLESSQDPFLRSKSAVSKVIRHFKDNIFALRF